MNRRRSPLLAATMLTLALTGCAGPSGTASPNSSVDPDYGTRSVTDCTGATSTFTSAPERVATVTTSVLEILLALGLEDRIVGVQAVAPGAFPADLQAVADTFPKLGGEYVPGDFVPVQREELLSVEPDFVVGGWASNFDSSLGALSQDELAERGVPSYFALAASCARTEPVTDLSAVYADIENYGTIFDVEEEAAALIDDMKATVDGVQEKLGDVDPPRVFTYSLEDGGAKAYSAGNQFLGNAIIQLAGGENIFADTDAVYGNAGWEEVVARDPEVIVLEVFGKPTEAAFDEAVQRAKDFFTTDPALQDITAVREGNFVPMIDEAYYVGGVRNAEAVEILARAFHPDVFAE
ncbi:ABC transporter substrate-binding protein [Microbacterium sp. RD1]|uniref:ABC transporter substrate-binding protein n=1 Tax=Microbacterium sp. RD1 TaxID=3457313 RepID=UPI003FA5900A